MISCAYYGAFKKAYNLYSLTIHPNFSRPNKESVHQWLIIRYNNYHSNDISGNCCQEKCRTIGSYLDKLRMYRASADYEDDLKDPLRLATKALNNAKKILEILNEIQSAYVTRGANQ